MTRVVLVARWSALVAGSALTLWLSAQIAFRSPEPWNAVVPALTLIPALIVLRRRDWHIVGWLLLVVAANNSAQFSAEFLPSAVLTPQWLGWVFTVLNSAFWAAMAALVAVFPEGLRQQEGGPRVADRIIVVSALAMTALSAFTAEVQAASWSGPQDAPLYPNPLGFGFLPLEAGAALTAGAILMFIAATVTLVVRTRRATGAVRQQHIWVLFPFAVLVLGVPIALTITQLRGEPGEEWVIAILSYIAIPVCFGVAMTRYRLYDIGKIISRTVTYTLVVAVLGAVSFGLVTLLTTLLPSQNDLAVAGSTLAVAALFNPIRRRIRHTVDRRFNRTAYMAATVIEEFAARLRESLDTEELAEVWDRTVNESFHPKLTGIWIKEDSQ